MTAILVRQINELRAKRIKTFARDREWTINDVILMRCVMARDWRGRFGLA